MENFESNFERGPERGLERFPIQESRFDENEAFLAQKIATEKEGIPFSQRSKEESIDFASELIGELRAEDLGLDGLDWERIREAKTPNEIIFILKEYAGVHGVDRSKLDEYLEYTKNEPSDLSRIKKFAFLVSFLALLGASEIPSESSAAPLARQAHVREYTEPEMEAIKDAEVYHQEFTQEQLRDVEWRYEDYFKRLKSDDQEIRDIKIEKIIVSQKVLEDTEHGSSTIPAVVVEVALMITTKDGQKAMLEDKSFKNINVGQSITADSLFGSVVEYAVKKGLMSPSLITRSDGGGWKANWAKKFQTKLIDESIKRIGDQEIKKLLP